MVLYVLRALFVLLMAALGWFYIAHVAAGGEPGTSGVSFVMPATIALSLLFIAADVFSPRRKLSILAGSFFGLLVGIAIAYALSFVVSLLVDNYYHPQLIKASEVGPRSDAIKGFIDMIIGVVSCYLSISFVLQTKDDFRFIVPYVEFSKQTKGARPILLDTSVLIDGRIADIVPTGLIESQLVVPNFVVDELQAVADSADRLKRNRGRRGLDILARLRKNERAEVLLYDSPRAADDAGVDHQLVQLAKVLNARVLTNDYNLNKVAQLSGVDVVNINDLSSALRPALVAGEKMRIQITKAGEEPGQGVGYLDDGTMVVVEQARPFISQEVEFVVTRALQTSAGRMIFGRLASESAAPVPTERRPSAPVTPPSVPAMKK
ncbi:MAG TPA: PIN domain-containing protein [Tepidisphaeraceae bacterium]|nr:PIN domain-containing protein [Tepidisphaeraceae bacterium]